MLLTDTAELHPATAAFLAESPSLARTRVLGGPTAIADGVLGATPGAERYGAANRMGTAVEITDRLWRPALGTLDAFTIVNLGNYGTEAQYEAWTVALAAAPLAAKYDAPELGVFLDGYPDETRAFLEGEGFSSLPAVVLVGGVNVIAQDVADGLTATLDG